VKFFIAKIVLFPARLDFDEATCSSHHDIHIDLGIPILGVVQIEKGHLIDETHANRSDRGA
jgi:capsular polysaccharide biosynthesis protein